MDHVNKKKCESHYSSSDWSNLPTDLLITVSNKITDIADFSRFRCVCKSWNLASKKSTFKTPQIPWLLLPYDARNTTRSFINPSSQAIFNFDLPEARDHAIIGSSNGWLVLVNRNFNLTILNPVTRAQIEHPIPEPTYFKDKIRGSSTQALCLIAESLRCYVYISPIYPEFLTDCVLALFMKDYSHVLFCKIGDKSWKRIRFMARHISSLTYHKGKIYVLAEDTGSVSMCDPNSGSPIVIRLGLDAIGFSYFVKRGNELLLLFDHAEDEDYDYYDSEMKEFEVYKLDESDDSDGSNHSENGGTDYEDDSDHGGLNGVSDDDNDSEEDYVLDGAVSGDDDYDQNYDSADYGDHDFDDKYIYKGSVTWLEYYEPSDYSIFFTSDMVSTIFCNEPSFFKGKSVCYSSVDTDGCLDDIILYNLEDQTGKTLVSLRGQRFYPDVLKPIWFIPSLY